MGLNSALRLNLGCPGTDQFSTKESGEIDTELVSGQSLRKS